MYGSQNITKHHMWSTCFNQRILRLFINMTMLLIALLYICYIDAITMVPPVYAMIII
jgi:hypothetical protein